MLSQSMDKYMQLWPAK